MDLRRWVRYQWDRTGAIVLVVLGLSALLFGWLGVSRVTLPGEQIPYLASGGLLGLFALGVGATLWLSADLRDEWRKLDGIHQALHELAAREPDMPGNAKSHERADDPAKITESNGTAPRPARLRAGSRS